MRSDLILGALSGVALIGVIVVDTLTGSIPDVLAATLTTLIGATAGVSVSRGRSDTSGDSTNGEPSG